MCDGGLVEYMLRVLPAGEITEADRCSFGVGPEGLLVVRRERDGAAYTWDPAGGVLRVIVEAGVTSYSVFGPDGRHECGDAESLAAEIERLQARQREIERRRLELMLANAILVPPPDPGAGSAGDAG